MKILRFLSTSRFEGRFVQQSSSRDAYGHVVLEITPSNVQEIKCSCDALEVDIPSKYFDAIRNGILAWLHEQQMACVNTEIRIIGGSHNETDSSEASYSRAAAIAFQNAAKSDVATYDA